MCFESPKFTVECHEYGSQDSNNVERRMNLLACCGKLLLPQSGTMLVSSWHQRQQRQQQQSFAITWRNLSRGLEFGSLFLDDKHAVDILIFKYVWFDTMMNMKIRFWRDVIFQHWEGDSWEVSYAMGGVKVPLTEKKIQKLNGWNSWMRNECIASSWRIQAMFLQSANIQSN